MQAAYADGHGWPTQKMPAARYDVFIPAINRHLKRVVGDGGLIPDAVVKEYLITAADGKNDHTKHDNLSAIIAVGYKAHSERAVQFRKWAAGTVKNYAVQGRAMDAERLKKGIGSRTAMQDRAKRLDGFLEFMAMKS